MMQPPSKTAVEGDFSQSKIVLHGSIYLLRAAAGTYYITESDLIGKPWEHKIDYTLGNRRVQHYLTTLPDGRIILIPAVWDNAAHKWTHDVDVGNPEEASGDRILIWNKTCYSCHVTSEQKSFDPTSLTYHTTWDDQGVSCESCHGAGKEHIAHAGKAPIVNPARLDPMRSTMVCAQCHSFRSIYADGFQAGDNYYDYFLPDLEYRQSASDDPEFYPDGRPRWFANDAVALWQSQCFLKGGATCLTCHSQPHNPEIESNPQLRAANNALCTGCHKAIGANVPAHTHHAPAGAGSSCVECHMPAVSIGLKAQIRDHSIGIPTPENTVRHGIPNACNLCHRDKDAAWAAAQTIAWYGPQSGQEAIRRAGAFTAARRTDPAAIPALLAILADQWESPILRANAAGYLGNYPDNPDAYNAVHGAFSDPDPFVRSTAATVLKPSRGERAAVAVDLVPLLRDPARTVRMSACMAMVTLGVKPFPGDDGARFEQAKDLFRARAALYSDDPEQQFAAGRFFFQAGDMSAAADAFRLTLKLDPATPAQYPLARSLAEKGDFPEARKIAQAISPADPQYKAAQVLLSEIDAKESARPATQPNAAEANFADGQDRFKGQFYRAALNDFEEALRLAPQAEWALKAQIDRAICLEKLGQTSEAEAAMQSLAELPAARHDLDFQLAYVELLTESGRNQPALQRIDQVIQDIPNAPLAVFSRAKVLLELRRTTDAAAAAEESIRLQPELPQAHNLLVRIYQMEGRMKEAAEQAEWLRDYQRRTLPK
jgi:predicted CXXCH cytochrome family protein